MTPPSSIDRRPRPALQSVDGSVLKQICAYWGYPDARRKPECMDYLHSAFDNVEKIRAMLGRMEPDERNALGLLNWFGGSAQLGALTTGVRATGTAPKTAERSNEYLQNDLGSRLMKRGLALPVANPYGSSLTYLPDHIEVCASPTVLSEAPRPVFAPLPVAVAPPPPSASARRAQAVVLDILGVLGAVRDIGGVNLTSAGRIRVNEIRRISKRLGWDAADEAQDTHLPDATRAFVWALLGADLVAGSNGTASVPVALEEVARRPAPSLIHAVLAGFLRANDWAEETVRPLDEYCRTARGAARFALLVALASLPDPHAWYQLDEFARALFDRIGLYMKVHSIYQVHTMPSRSAPAMDEGQRARASWDHNEAPWMDAALRTWLFAFGIVELEVADASVQRFRLTDLGRTILWCDAAATEAPRDGVAGLAWVVQPNFDLVVYLENTGTQQLSFLEQYAERINVAQHAAQYRLTRESVYRGLESGGDIEHLVTGLEAGSRTPMPSNVQIEIRGWAGLRERITLRRAVNLMEFPDGAAREVALATGVEGTPLGDRFLLMAPGQNDACRRTGCTQVIDYGRPASSCLRIDEAGVVKLGATTPDLVTAGILDLWATREGDGVWRFTREGVARAARSGGSGTDLLRALKQRTAHPIPTIIDVALRAWAAGGAETAALDDAIIVRSSRPDVLAALAKKSELRPFVLGMLGADKLVVDRAGADALARVMEWVGISTAPNEPDSGRTGTKKPARRA